MVPTPKCSFNKMKGWHDIHILNQFDSCLVSMTKCWLFQEVNFLLIWFSRIFSHILEFGGVFWNSYINSKLFFHWINPDNWKEPYSVWHIVMIAYVAVGICLKNWIFFFILITKHWRALCPNYIGFCAKNPSRTYPILVYAIFTWEVHNKPVETVIFITRIGDIYLLWRECKQRTEILDIDINESKYNPKSITLSNVNY